MWSAATLAIWAALSASRSVGIRGRRPFIFMQLAIALWAGTAGAELLAREAATYAWLARVQYVGITSLPVLWLFFTGSYAHRLDPRERWLGVLWLIPIATVAAAFTNPWHHLLWTDVIMPGPDEVLPTYVRGPVFWVNWVYAYVLIAVGTVWLALTLPHYSARYRIQLWLLILGVLAPWIGNLLYILGRVPLPGLDMTPLAFAISGACFVASVFAAKR